MYRTGDLGSYDEEGNIVFAGRKDFQIKHMGHRIELEEIERSMTALDGVEKSCCVFDMEKNRIMGFYLGEKAASDVRKQMKEKLPVYMVNTCIRIFLNHSKLMKPIINNNPFHCSRIPFASQRINQKIQAYLKICHSKNHDSLPLKITFFTCLLIHCYQMWKNF